MNCRYLIYIIFSLACLQLEAQETPTNYQNPILPGFHPDPSICRVGADYYLVNSSFEWYPGLPIYHSKDLVNWELIGYGIHRPDQVELPRGLPDSRGVYAPSIRYHDGVFYIINTCVKCKGNFYITAQDPKGPWSDPIWLGSRGIDPSLFWDEDGTCYYTGHANISGLNDWPNKNGAWMQVLDIEQGKLVGDRKQLTHGHAKNARWTEGPHIYKIEDKYILLVAEGGTGFHHAITTHYSDNIWGPYTPHHSNPVLTHRHLGQDYPIHSVGHGDLIQTQNGEWWAVTLAKRKQHGQTLLARESFLTPINWEDQEGIPTPVFNPGVGKLLPEQKRPDLPWSPINGAPSRDEFTQSELALQWNFLRTPYEKWYRLDGNSLRLNLRPEVVDSFENPSLIARRIQHHTFTATTKLNFSSTQTHEQAGLILYRRSTHHYEFMKSANHLILFKTHQGTKEEVAKIAYAGNFVVLQAKARGREVSFFYGPSIDQLQSIGLPQDLSILSDEKAGGFNGPYVGMYATSKGQPSESSAVFDWFEYTGK